jgi:non-specific serine/threonine protein kinase
VRLFTDRAQRARPDFQVTAGNADAVAGLCRLLEGIPLAIELAAARARVLTPGQMLETLSTDRFPLLTRRGSAAPDGDARHRSLWATLDWSFRLLPPELQRFFARLSVFRGGWSHVAAETVCEEPRALEYLTQLRVHSLIQTEDAGDEMRFRMLETLREFAGEQLTQDERRFLARRHLRFFRDLAAETEPKIHGPEQKAVLDRLEWEHDNVRAALTWSQNDPAEGESGLRLAGALSWFWHLRSHFAEGRSWLGRALESRPAATDARATALQGAGQLTYYLGDHAGAQVLLEESARLWWDLGNRRGTAYALVYLGAAAFEQGDHGTARAVLAESVALARATEDLVGPCHGALDVGRTRPISGR